MIDISANLKYLRNLYKFKQKEVALGIQVTAQAYSKYESGTRSLNIDLLEKLSNFYKVPILLFLYPIESLMDKFKNEGSATLSELILFFELMFYEAHKINEELDLKYAFSRSKEVEELLKQMRERRVKAKNIEYRISGNLKKKISIIDDALYKKRQL